MTSVQQKYRALLQPNVPKETYSAELMDNSEVVWNLAKTNLKRELGTYINGSSTLFYKL